ncbi:hypothetical protein NST02_18225 [Robertmurraya sp. FSL W8-0741]|uniref:hypothetical protein n=1 Tax=Robertmurraya sp. FSL W8-0741 TaxID=2954629 RepID=UPI0030FC0DEB
MKVQISLNNGLSVTADIEGYNATELATKINDPKLIMITIGDIIVNKNAVYLIAPVQEQA